MSIKKIDQIKKKDKGFKIWDILIYAIILLAVAALLLSVFLTRSRDELAGFYVYYKDDIVFSYEFDAERYDILDDGHIKILEETSSSLTLRFFVDAANSDEDYNDIYVDKDERYVDVIDADCSQHKECYYMDKIVDTGSAIICSPHRMNIIPFGYTLDDTGISTG
ncbi:MAG: hypothetical protein LUD29_01190 [Clostridia bacterium]|nr:hypothetical protein [Clostridia bacterium]